MLIKFQSKATAAFSMLDDDAKPLLRGMGHPDKLEGSVSGNNLSDALTQLEAALAAAAEAPIVDASASEGDDPDEEPPVNISVRAVPLVNMLHKAKNEDTYVMWRPE